MSPNFKIVSFRSDFRLRKKGNDAQRLREEWLAFYNLMPGTKADLETTAEGKYKKTIFACLPVGWFVCCNYC